MKASGDRVKFGRVELVILAALVDVGVTARDRVIRLAFPDLGSPAGPTETDRQARRLRAEAAVSRAIASLERKGMVVRERNELTGRIQIHSAGGGAMPAWEQLARGEEDLAAHCRAMSERWHELFVRARIRAEVIRRDMSGEGTAAERDQDLELIGRIDQIGG